jgi:hypothetical protein
MLDFTTKEDQVSLDENWNPSELKAGLALRHRKIHDGHDCDSDRDCIKVVLLRSEDWSI